MDLQQEIHSLLHAFGIGLKRNLGQNFLIDREVLDAILDAAAVEETDHVVEIGPGIGVLTRELLQDAAHVTAIELDARMLPVLTQFAAPTPELRKKLTVIHGNALQVPFPDHPYIIVANIPYHITSPLLRHAFLESAVRPSSATLLIQREVAEKICDTKHAGLLTIIVGLFGTPSIAMRVPPGAFLPPPKVDSAVLHIKSHPHPLADRDTIEKVLKLVKLAFGQKRKMLRNSIGSLPDGMELMEKAGIDPTGRPERLTIGQWIRMAKNSSTSV